MEADRESQPGHRPIDEKRESDEDKQDERARDTERKADERPGGDDPNRVTRQAG